MISMERPALHLRQIFPPLAYEPADLSGLNVMLDSDPKQNVDLVLAQFRILDAGDSVSLVGVQGHSAANDAGVGFFGRHGHKINNLADLVNGGVYG